jgi:hypothetical protein
VALLAVGLFVAGCDAAPPSAAPLAAQESLSDSAFAALVERASEPGGYFDTDNLISNESGYLKVVDVLEARVPEGAAYIGVGPDQSYSYVAALRPRIAFVLDVRRDNLLHHLLLKALIERAETRVEFLAGLHGVAPPADPVMWVGRSAEDVVSFVDEARPDPDVVRSLADELRRRIDAYGVPLSDADHHTIRRFHQTFIDAGLSLRFTSFGRPPRPYYPTNRQLVLETDIEGERASYLASGERYAVVRDLHRANRIVPVVGDMAGPHAVREIGAILREMGVAVGAFYASNVEFYLWQDGTLGRWVDNVAALPAVDEAVVIRSYFPNAGRPHPSALRGYYATQSLQPIATLAAGGFTSYWDLVTRDVLELDGAARR